MFFRIKDAGLLLRPTKCKFLITSLYVIVLSDLLEDEVKIFLME